MVIQASSKKIFQIRQKLNPDREINFRATLNFFLCNVQNGFEKIRSTSIRQFSALNNFSLVKRALQLIMLLQSSILARVGQTFQLQKRASNFPMHRISLHNRMCLTMGDLDNISKRSRWRLGICFLLQLWKNCASSFSPRIYYKLIAQESFCVNQGLPSTISWTPLAAPLFSQN